MDDCCTRTAEVGKSSSEIDFYWIICRMYFIIVNFSLIAASEDEEDVKEDETKLTEDMVQEFSSAWAMFDPYATKFIQHTQISDLLYTIEPPLGVGKAGSRHKVWQVINEISIPVHDNCRIHYAEVLFALAKRMCGTTLPDDTKIYQKIQRQ